MSSLLPNLRRDPCQDGLSAAATRRCRFERLEPRQLLAADFALGPSMGLTGSPTGTVSGKVLAASTDGSCVDHVASSQIADVLVQLMDNNGKVIEEKLTDAAGNFSFTNLLPGQYAVRQQTPDGFSEFTAHNENNSGSILSPLEIGAIEVQADQSLSGFTFCNLSHSSENREHGPSSSDSETGINIPTGQALPVLALSLQTDTLVAQQTVVDVPQFMPVAMAQPISLSSLEAQSQPAIFGGSSRELQPTREIEPWSDDLFDNWFSATFIQELIDAPTTSQSQFEPTINEVVKSDESNERDEAFADSSTSENIPSTDRADWQDSYLAEWSSGPSLIELAAEQLAKQQAAVPQVAQRYQPTKP